MNAEQVIVLRPGRNMVSLTVDPADRSITSIFTGRVVVYRYDSAGRYVPVREMEAGEGYFVLSETDQTGSALGPPVIRTERAVTAAGWMLVSAVFRPEDFSGPDDSPDGAVGGRAWTLSDTGYVETSILEPGKAYWVKADAAGRLTIGRDNTPGVVSNVSITGATASDTTFIHYTWTDGEDDLDKSMIEWRQNGVPIAIGNKVLPEEKQEGYPLEARILSFDGIGYGELKTQEFELQATDVVPPKVDGTNLSANYDPSQDILVDLSEELDPAKVVAANIELKKGNQQLSVIPSLEGRTLRIRSTKPYNSDLSLRLKKEMTDRSGNALDGNGDGTGGDDYTATLRTMAEPDNTPPTILQTNLTQSMAVKDTLEFLFSEPVDPNTINSNTIQVLLGTQKINGLVTYDEQAKKAYFKSDADLAFNTNYNVPLSSEIKDLAGNRLSATNRTFKTIPQTNFPPQFSHIPDQTTNEDTPKTVDLKTYLSDDNLSQVTVSASNNTNISVTIDGNKVATFTPALNWSRAEDIIFTATDPEYTARDTVKVTVNPVNDAPVADFDAPTSVEVANDRAMTANVSDVEDDQRLLEVRWQLISPVLGSQPWTEWTKEKTANFLWGQIETVQQKMQVRDTEGAVSEKTKSIQVTSDKTPPYVIRTNANEGFSIKNTIEIDVNEDLLSEENLRLEKQNGDLVSGQTSYSRSQKKLKFKPTSYLQQNSVYRIRIPPQITDLRSNQFDGNHDGVGGDAYVHEFRTEQINDVIPPKIVSSNLSNSAAVADTIKLYIPDNESLRRELVTANQIKVKVGGGESS
ncbi:MAG: Ig-like domain-containing protein [bacterium]|nr:Ig-like domain-containing protein [bacterium]